jgi:hypothetical protein
MNCRRASLASVERDLSGLPADVEAALKTHLAGCPACAERERAERLMLEDLAALRRTAPDEVDVRERVAAALRDDPPLAPRDVSPWQLGWAAAAALAAVAVLLPAVGASLRSAAPALRDLRAAAEGLATAAGSLISALVGIAAVPAGWLLGIVGPDGPLWALAERAQPAAVGTTAVLYATMAVAITIVVGRDLRRPVPQWDRKER